MSKRLGILLGIGLFALSTHARQIEKDSLNPNRIPDRIGEIKLNPDVTKEINFGTIFPGKQTMLKEKPALNVDATLPNIFPDKEKKEIRLSLCPYTPNTKYNYDPIYRKQIKIKGDTWKYGENFYMNMAFNMAASGGSSGGDLMLIFTKDFWDKKGRRRKARTLEVLQSYGDSTTVLIREEIKKAAIR
ncbi:MAG: DUF4858 domain-containing protein [Mediterranea sp.]|nr:DUF4858 domain-containing protein [Mediterranea sp.]